MKSLQQIIELSAKPVLVEFYTPGCPRCTEEAPVMAELINKEGSKAEIVQVNMKANPEIAEAYKVHTHPTFILFKDGQEAWRDSGVKPYGELLDMIHRFE